MMQTEKMSVLKALNNPWKLRWYLFWRLPSLYFWRVRVESLSEEQSEISIPFFWLTQNPFKSLYFSALLGAGEFASGVLCLVGVSGGPPVSMLVVNLEAAFYKKAKPKVFFRCDDGPIIQAAISKAIESGEGQQVTALAKGFLPDGALACEVKVTWSFKRKN